MTECRICLGECQQDIHAATLRIRRWLLEQSEPPVIRPNLKGTTVKGADKVPRRDPIAGYLGALRPNGG